MIKPALLTLLLLVTFLPGQDPAWKENGRKLLRSQRPLEAARFFESAARERPGEWAPLHLAGVSYSSARRFARAIDFLNRAKALAPNEAAIHFDLASTYANQGSPGATLEALRAFDVALAGASLPPERAGHLAYLRGVAAERLHRTTESIQAFTAAVGHIPNNAHYRERLGLALFNSGRYEPAVAQFQQLVRLEPNNAGFRFSLGASQMDAGQREAARATLEKACSLDRKEHRAWLRLGRLHMIEGDVRRAQACLEMAIEANPQAYEAMKTLATIANRKGLREEANDYLQRYEALVAKARQYEEQVRKLRRRFTSNPQDTAARMELASLLLRNGRVDEASELFQEVIVIDPTHELATVNFAQSLAARGLIREAFHEHDRLLEANPTHPISNLESAKCCVHLGNKLEAVRRFLKATEGLALDDARYAQAVKGAWNQARAARKPQLVLPLLRRSAKAFRGDARLRIEILAMLGQTVLDLKADNPPIQELEFALGDLGNADPLKRQVVSMLIRLAQMTGDQGRALQYREMLAQLGGG